MSFTQTILYECVTHCGPEKLESQPLKILWTTFNSRPLSSSRCWWTAEESTIGADFGICDVESQVR